MTILIIIMIMMTALLITRHVRLAKIARHDEGLYPLCETRRAMYRFMADNAATLSKKEYSYLKRQLDDINWVIHEYEDLTYTTFRLRKLADLLKPLLKLKKDKLDIAQRQMNSIDNQELKELSKRFYEQFLCCFFVHTPFVAIQKIMFTAFCWYANKSVAVAKEKEKLRQKVMKKEKKRVRIRDAQTRQSSDVMLVFSEFYKTAEEPRRLYSENQLSYVTADCN